MACALAAAVSACGKKGPPLPPLVYVPDAVPQMIARRVGDDVFLTLTLPTRNIDTSTPVNLGRVEVYGYTGLFTPPVARFTEVASLIGTVDPATGAGGDATLRDPLTPDDLVAGRRLVPRGGPAAAAPGPAPGEGRVILKRFYLAVAFSDRGLAGPPSAVVDLPLTPVPDAPLDVRVTYTAEAATLTWEPSGGLVGFLLDRALPAPSSPLDDGPSLDEGTLPAGPTRYNIYREMTPGSSAVTPTDSTPAPSSPVPVNPMPIAGLTFTEALQIDGQRRCYTISAVRGTPARQVEGRPSAPACLTPVDTFPPAPPTGVSPIAAEGEISLVWEASPEPDLRGYLVLRGEAGDATLTPITEQVVTETRFSDRNVRPGVVYVYAVTAVDTRLPRPNVSAESERVEIAAR